MRPSATFSYLLLVVAILCASMWVWEVSADQETKKQRKLIREKSKQQPKIRRTIRVREEEPRPTELPSTTTTTTTTTTEASISTTEQPAPQQPSINNELLNQGSTNNIEVKPEISIQMPAAQPPHPQPHPVQAPAPAPAQQQPQPQSIVVNQEQNNNGPQEQQQQQQQTTEAPAEQQGKVSNLVNKFNQLERQNSSPAAPGSEHVELDGVGNSRVLKISNSGNHDQVEIHGTGNTRHLSESDPPKDQKSEDKQPEEQRQRDEGKGEEPEEERARPLELHNVAAPPAKLEEPARELEAPVLEQEPQFRQSHLGRLMARAAAEQQQQPHHIQPPKPMAPSNFMLLPQSPQGGYTIAAQPLIMSPTIYGVMQAPYLAAAAATTADGTAAMWGPPAGFSMQAPAPQMLQPLAAAMTPQMMYNTQANAKLAAGHPACVTSWMTKPRRASAPKSGSDKRAQQL